MHRHWRFVRVLGVLALLVALSSLSVPSALAMEPRVGQTVIVGPNEVINDDLYAAGNSVRVDGRVTGDLVAAGGNVEINGSVGGGVIAAGGNVVVRGDVERSVRVAGGNLVIQGRVAEDVVAAGGNFELAKAAQVGRDVAFTGGSAHLASNIARKVLGSAGRVTISGTIGGNTRIDSDNLVLQDGAEIKGNLDYSGSNEATITQGARVDGKTTYAARQRPSRGAAAFAFIGFFQVLGFFAVLLIGLIIVLLAPRYSALVSDSIRGRAWPVLGWGALVLFVTPVAIVVVMVTLIGIPLALITLALYLIGVYLSEVFVALFLGRVIWRAFGWMENRWWMLLQLLVGLIILAIATNIPFLGFFVRLGIVLFGLGALWLTLLWHPWVERPAPPTTAL